VAVRRPSPADHGRSETRERPDVARAFERERRLLAQRLRALRLERKLSQEAAAEVIGLSPKHLRRNLARSGSRHRPIPTPLRPSGSDSRILAGGFDAAGGIFDKFPEVAH
jgi:hypothetical protein